MPTKTESVVKPRIEPKINIKPPPSYKVIYINDEVTTMEFVIESLMNFFDYNTDSAVKITQDIHEAGAAVVAVLPFEVAEQKAMDSVGIARNNGFPLSVSVEAE